MEKINPFAYLYYHLYLLQLEEYNLVRFFRVIWRTKGIPQATLRKKLVFTPKMILITLLSLGYIVGLAAVYHVVFLFALYISYVPLCIVVFVITPLDLFLKKIKIGRAKSIIQKYPDLKVVGIAGSYGKTTMKEAISTILAEKYSVLKTPENINTPLGIADLIIKKLDERIQVLVVEMGEYSRGDIADICSLVKPQIGIITGINEAHLERMGSIENTVDTIFELAQHTEKDGALVLNNDNEYIRTHYKKYVSHQRIILYSSNYETELKSGLLGRYARGVLQAGEEVGLHFGLSMEQIQQGAAKIQALPHRLQPIEGSRGVLVIDDSYNGNPTGVSEAIYVLSTYQGRRKVYITPGLVETGEKTKEIHRQIGKELSQVANIVVLIKNSATPFIAEGLVENGFQKENIKWYNSTEAAHADMGNIVEPNDVVMFQNDWTDNYV
jgi:UDP-N-acetylmuramoyl-tripeptide--D-alanyl-D-alanine ligase